MKTTIDAAADATPAPACTGKDAGPAFSNNSTLAATGFENDAIAPFTICTTKSPNYGRAATLNGDSSIQFFWTSVGYDGTRDARGAEACSALAFYKDGWYGLKFYLPSPNFPTTKTDGIAQIFCNGGCSSWAAMLQVHSNQLWLVYRGNCVATPQYQVMLASDIQRNVWNPVIIHFIASGQKAGGIELWYGDDVCTQAHPTYRNMNINFGFGTWTSEDTLTPTVNNRISLKFGMYNFDDGNYDPSETRTLYYDNVSQLVGDPSNAWTLVNPGR